MHSFILTALVALASIQQSTALLGSKMQHFSNMAEMGLLPDGTPMRVSVEEHAAVKVSMLAAPPPPPPDTIQPEYVTLPLDNFAKNKDYSYYGTFNNRYWVSTAAYKLGGPVFLYDAGEADAAPNAVFRLSNETSFFKQLVDKFSGIGIVWEHRYYGNSTPEPIDLNTPWEVFRHLNTEQSLADVDRFAKQFSRKEFKQDLTPSGTPWVFVGGSYPGMRAAFMRDKYPDTIFASWASSAPTEARTDMSIYFEPVWKGMNAYGFGNCTRDIQAAILYMDDIMENSKQSAKLKEKFLGLGAANNSNAVFGDALNTIFWLWQSYGVEGGTFGLRPFCDWIETDPRTNKTAPAEGWAKRKDVEWTVDRWAAYKWFTPMVNEYLETDCSGNVNKTGKCDLNRRFTDPASIAWTWQYCTEWGYFQSSNEGPHQLISRHNSLTHQRDICHRQFPSAQPPLFPAWPRTDLTNRVFGGWDIRPSNTFWTGGEFDPWRTLSPLSDERDAPHPRIRNEVPRCGQSDYESAQGGRGGGGGDEIFAMVLKGAQHCYDLRTTFAGGEPARVKFAEALRSWLGCWKPQKKKGGN
jgi:hypothetical protein